MSDDESNKISIEDAIRLKHTLNQTITYRGYNAKEVSEIESLTKDQYDEISRQLSEIRKSWWFFPDYVWIIGLIVSGFCSLYFSQYFIRIISLLSLIYCIAQLGYRSGLLYGYVRGYESGHEDGVHKALGVPPEDAAEISERATEMELDEMLIKKMDERKNHSTK